MLQCFYENNILFLIQIGKTLPKSHTSFISISRLRLAVKGLRTGANLNPILKLFYKKSAHLSC